MKSHYYSLSFSSTRSQKGKSVTVHFPPPIEVMGFPGVLGGKESACSAGNLGSSPVLERSPGGGHGNPLQYSCLENPMDRGARWATVHGVAESDMTEPLSTAHILSDQIRSDQSLSHVRLCDPMNCSMPGFSVHHQLPEFSQTHVPCITRWILNY